MSTSLHAYAAGFLGPAWACAWRALIVPLKASVEPLVSRTLRRCRRMRRCNELSNSNSAPKTSQTPEPQLPPCLAECSDGASTLPQGAALTAPALPISQPAHRKSDPAVAQQYLTGSSWCRQSRRRDEPFIRSPHPDPDSVPDPISNPRDPRPVASRANRVDKPQTNFGRGGSVVPFISHRRYTGGPGVAAGVGVGSGSSRQQVGFGASVGPEACAGLSAAVGSDRGSSGAVPVQPLPRTASDTGGSRGSDSSVGSGGADTGGGRGCGSGGENGGGRGSGDSGDSGSSGSGNAEHPGSMTAVQITRRGSSMTAATAAAAAAVLTPRGLDCVVAVHAALDATGGVRKALPPLSVVLLSIIRNGKGSKLPDAITTTIATATATGAATRGVADPEAATGLPGDAAAGGGDGAGCAGVARDVTEVPSAAAIQLLQRAVHGMLGSVSVRVARAHPHQQCALLARLVEVVYSTAGVSPVEVVSEAGQMLAKLPEFADPESIITPSKGPYTSLAPQEQQQQEQQRLPSCQEQKQLQSAGIGSDLSPGHLQLLHAALAPVVAALPPGSFAPDALATVLRQKRTSVAENTAPGPAAPAPTAPAASRMHAVSICTELRASAHPDALRLFCALLRAEWHHQQLKAWGPKAYLQANITRPRDRAGCSDDAVGALVLGAAIAELQSPGLLFYGARDGAGRSGRGASSLEVSAGVLATLNELGLRIRYQGHVDFLTSCLYSWRNMHQHQRQGWLSAPLQPAVAPAVVGSGLSSPTARGDWPSVSGADADAAHGSEGGGAMASGSSFAAARLGKSILDHHSFHEEIQEVDDSSSGNSCVGVEGANNGSEAKGRDNSSSSNNNNNNNNSFKRRSSGGSSSHGACADINTTTNNNTNNTNNTTGDTGNWCKSSSGNTSSSPSSGDSTSTSITSGNTSSSGGRNGSATCQDFLDGGVGRGGSTTPVSAPSSSVFRGWNPAVDPALARVVVRVLLHLGYYEHIVMERLVAVASRRRDGTPLQMDHWRVLQPQDGQEVAHRSSAVFLQDQLALGVRYGCSAWSGETFPASDSVAPTLYPGFAARDSPGQYHNHCHQQRSQQHQDQDQHQDQQQQPQQQPQQHQDQVQHQQPHHQPQQVPRAVAGSVVIDTARAPAVAPPARADREELRGDVASQLEGMVSSQRLAAQLRTAEAVLRVAQAAAAAAAAERQSTPMPSYTGSSTQPRSSTPSSALSQPVSAPSPASSASSSPSAVPPAGPAPPSQLIALGCLAEAARLLKEVMGWSKRLKRAPAPGPASATAPATAATSGDKGGSSGSTGNEGGSSTLGGSALEQVLYPNLAAVEALAVEQLSASWLAVLQVADAAAPVEVKKSGWQEAPTEAVLGDTGTAADVVVIQSVPPSHMIVGRPEVAAIGVAGADDNTAVATAVGLEPTTSILPSLSSGVPPAASVNPLLLVRRSRGPTRGHRTSNRTE
ncbi:hypothetical protein Vafri_15198 [Volvox africanus]|uniref:Uncharacterized protein n=1 Tax=Volvox africanus TaxID=51714 RepID=A0A8J4F7L7_9CHLO|nr:hypothetical protein Vafri_15198 [Volvox africanus]